jgi:hypothetical protein
MNLELPIITLDIDWAPDWIIDEVASILIEHRVKATWFVTHRGMAVERLRDKTDLFEVGMHPNCLPNSTHGDSEDEVLSHMKRLVPEAVSMRTHGLYQSSNFLKKAAGAFGIRNDASIILPGMHHIKPFKLKFGDIILNRIPYFWEDDLALLEKNSSWSLANSKYKCPGMKIFNFHPVHVILNTPNYSDYEELKLRHPFDEWTPHLIEDFVCKEQGPRNLFMDLVDLSRGGGTWIKEILP